MFFPHCISSYSTQNYLLVWNCTLRILCNMSNFISQNACVIWKECLFCRLTHSPNTLSVFDYMFVPQEVLSFLLTFQSSISSVHRKSAFVLNPVTCRFARFFCVCAGSTVTLTGWKYLMSIWTYHITLVVINENGRELFPVIYSH